MANVLFPLSDVEVKCNTKIEYYPITGESKITVSNRAIFVPKGFELSKPQNDSAPKPKNMLNGSRADSILRAKRKVFNIAALNRFKYFVTLTLDKAKINRYDKVQIKPKFLNFLNNKVKRNNMIYLFIGEYHKDGAIHFHGLINGNFNFVDSGKRDKAGRIIYNMPEWTFGFSTCVLLDENVSNVAKYITKYVSKEFQKIFGKFYFAGGKGLIREPQVEYCNSDYDSFDSKEYSAPIEALNLRFKYLTTEGGLLND